MRGQVSWKTETLTYGWSAQGKGWSCPRFGAEPTVGFTPEAPATGSFLGAAHKVPAVDSGRGGEAALSPAEFWQLGSYSAPLVPSQALFLCVPNLVLGPRPVTPQFSLPPQTSLGSPPGRLPWHSNPELTGPKGSISHISREGLTEVRASWFPQIRLFTSVWLH